MKNLFSIFAAILLMINSSYGQRKQYVYYMNDAMETVSKQSATIIGRGEKGDTTFTVSFFYIKNNELLARIMFTDSSLAHLHGHYMLYNNKKIVTQHHYINDMKHGKTIKRDSLGRVTDSAMYFEDMPVFLTRYAYMADGSRSTQYLFDNTYAQKTPDEKSIVLTDEGSVLPAAVWKNLAYGGKYAFRQDKANLNRFLVFRLSDRFFETMVAKDGRPEESTFFKTGQNFVIDERDMNNNRLRSKDLAGKVLVINYWFINCKPCRMEMPELNSIVHGYKDSANVKFIAIALDDKESVREFLKTTQFSYQIVPDGRIATEKYGVTAFPTHVIVGGDGKVYFHTVSSPRQLSYWIKKTVNELLEKERLKKS